MSARCTDNRAPFVPCGSNGASAQSRPLSTGAAISVAGSGSIGPAIVEERETTAVIRPGWTVDVADDGSLVAERSN